MDFLEKAKVKIKHWIHHSQDHEMEYEKFAKELERAGKEKSARYIKEMVEYTSKGTECLKQALEYLD